jgi:hypothetical protein
MRVVFDLNQIIGKPPREVALLFRRRGLNPTRPYRARLSFKEVVVEQD